MRGKAVKHVNAFTKVSWERTAEEDRPASYANFRRKCKREYCRNPKFKEFVKNFGEI